MRIVSIILGIGCFIMVAIGYWAFIHVFDHFQKAPDHNAIRFYNEYYFVPYVMTGSCLLVHGLAGISVFFRLLFSSIMVGMAVFTLFFVDFASIGHDFGHVIFNGCFESIQMNNIIIGFNVVLVIFSTLIVLFNYREYYKAKLKVIKK